MAGNDNELAATEDALSALAARLREDQVFGPVVQQGDTTLVPVAQVRTGGGLGGRKKRGTGGGVGAVARPVGAWAVTSEGAVWHPAVSVNRIVLGGQLALTAIGVACAIAFRRKR
ncbi:hypothetical protein GCM10027271_05000 [Saccharopolyspora gloriosae]|uniref:Putative spore protein YtfJ n=1 Tax=Saccharopolyspora gloriosae TaxID=455344 RepID=A0A840NV69_9PSEU|nr:hypothetical protein [Saccharopolyspora gloriosae]MBB5072047.1 putative spore protein YtfJ [Saccharopolyspora gloriosae]